MNFHESIIDGMKKTKSQCDRAIAQLTDADLHRQLDPESNSIAILMQHLAGNMLSRWTDFLTTDGEKPSRTRDAEFVDGLSSRDGLLSFWERGWECAFGAIESLKPEDMTKTVYIRGEAHSVPLALVRQLRHYAEHAGQIIYVAKHLRGSEWKTLSIPKKK